MRKFMFAALSVAAIAITDTAFADPAHVGFGMDVGAPSGGAVGVVVNPGLDWMRIEASLTYDYLSLGGRGSLQLDPMALINVRHQVPGLIWFSHDFPFGIFADVQGGFQPTASIPGHSDLPQVGFDYLNTYAGIRLGKPNGFHWNFEGGPTYMHISTSNFQSVLSGANAGQLRLGNPTVDGWVTPTFETGFTVVW